MTFKLKRLVSLCSKRKLLIAAAISSAGFLGGGALLLIQDPLLAYELLAEPPHYPWSHNGIFSTLDHCSVRRGYQVYKELVDVSHSVKQAKAEAAEVQVEDGPDQKGNMFMRPGKLTDKLPQPYKNAEAAKAANNGALPPDLTFMALARERGIDYVFSLLTGYEEPPEGVELDEGIHYNPFISGGKIAMQAPLYDDIIEYEDGTPATRSQLAKDVCTFLMWTSQMEHDERKFLALKIGLVLPFLLLIACHFKRVKWSSIKARKLKYFQPPPKYFD